MVCFFKQKSSYEMRISDGSSDVCSSDLLSSTDRGISNQFVEWIGNEKVRKLLVVSPYWDSNLSALSELAAELSPKEIILPIDSEHHEFPAEAAFAKKVDRKSTRLNSSH